ncbi:Mitotic exit network component [Bonamia ostreae]|uniref:Mitotic exit network component n=1 Tax=Bonamia ostreae TaxID=126728 RepID=A0ABV2AG89_9EUKA
MSADLNKLAESERLDYYLLGNIEEASSCPKNLNKDEWIAINIAFFYNEISVLYASIAKHCNENNEQCANSKNKTNVYTKKHIRNKLNQISNLFSDHAFFPVDRSVPLREDICDILSQISQGILKIFEHIYIAHHHEFSSLPMLNAFFLHFTEFNFQNNVLGDVDLGLLRPLYHKLLECRGNILLVE